MSPKGSNDPELTMCAMRSLCGSHIHTDTICSVHDSTRRGESWVYVRVQQCELMRSLPSRFGAHLRDTAKALLGPESLRDEDAVQVSALPRQPLFQQSPAEILFKADEFAVVFFGHCLPACHLVE